MTVWPTGGALSAKALSGARRNRTDVNIIINNLSFFMTAPFLLTLTRAGGCLNSL